MIPPMQKINEARAIDQRRPNRLVNGQTKKHEKKAVGQRELLESEQAGAGHTSCLQETV